MKIIIIIKIIYEDINIYFLIYSEKNKIQKNQCIKKFKFSFNRIIYKLNFMIQLFLFIF